MKASDLKKRLKKDRPMSPVTIRMPDDVVDDLKNIAPQLGFSGYQPLIRHYVGQGMRADLERINDSAVQNLVESLKRHGVDESILSQAISEISQIH